MDSALPAAGQRFLPHWTIRRNGRGLVRQATSQTGGDERPQPAGD